MELQNGDLRRKTQGVVLAQLVPFDLLVSDLNHSLWEQAQPVHLNHYWSGAPAPEGRQATAAILWSGEALHVRFTCRQTEPIVLNASPQTGKKTLGLWDRDVCEIFLAPDPNRPNKYFEFEVAPTGEWIDLGITLEQGQRETDWEFQSGLTTAARVEERLLVIGMRIPWSKQIPKPRRGEEWRANLYRCVGAGENRGYLVWQPTYAAEPNFHVPNAFGRLRFTRDVSD